ncbi:energy-coupling factor ABC transporter ATP-binding protein, partial [Actinoplanes philippinensis]|uniref:energy-coupling factor ABC transporter ATP-binding protein n=1 Tax=Actinoplanes philippinensis TaxID=35752 RepID=UPI003405EE05
MTAALSITGLTFAYPDGRQALHGIDLTLAEGERVALLGPNGAGKTTLVLHLNGILHGGEGRVEIAGLPVTPGDRRAITEIRRRVGIVFQDPDDQLFMPTVAEDVAFGPANLGVRGPDLDDRVTEALAAVGMLEHRDQVPQHLSWGPPRRGGRAPLEGKRPAVEGVNQPED